MIIRPVFYFIFLVSCFLFLPPPVMAADRDAQMKQARQLSWDKQYNEAIHIYERLLRRNPRDVEAAIGLATVTAWSGDYAKAQILYEEILDKHPDDRDTLLGLARVLFWQGQSDESLKIFDQLLTRHPQDAEILSEREKVVQSRSPNEAPNKPFKLRTRYRFEDLSFTSDAHGTGFLLSYEKPKKWAVRGGFDYLDKFGDSAPGYRVGGSYWAAKSTVLSLDMEFAPKQIIFPRQAYTFEISQTLFKKLVPFIGYRFADYASADAHILMPGATWYFAPRFDWVVRNFLSISRYSAQSKMNYSVMTHLNWNAVDPLTLSIGYARSNASFETGNPLDPFGGYSSNHVLAGFNWKIYKELGIDFSFDYERRNNGFSLISYETGVFYRW